MVAALVLTSTLGLTTAVLAGPKHLQDKEVERTVIKIEAEQEEEVIVVVGDNGDRNKYEFDFEELDNMDNVSAELDDLDAETKAKVLDLLNQVKANDSKVISFKDAEFIVDGEETQVFMVKTGNGEDQLHIEVDVEGQGASNEKRLFVKKFMGEGKGHGKIFRHMKNGDRDPVALIKKIIEKAELSDEQIAEVKAALEEN